MADYRSDLEKAKQLEALNNRKIEPVANATVRKRTGLDKIKNKFESTNAVQGVIVPTIKKTLFDVLYMFMFNGERAPGSNYGNRGNGVNVSYSGYYNKVNQSQQRPVARPINDSFVLKEDLSYDNLIQAQDVLAKLNETIDQFSMVRVADLYEYSGRTCPSYTGNSYGWFNLDSVRPIPLLNGRWILDLPDAVPLI